MTKGSAAYNSGQEMMNISLISKSTNKGTISDTKEYKSNADTTTIHEDNKS